MQIQILSLITPGVALIFGALFAVLWWRDRAQIHILGYTTGFLMLVVSFMMIALLFGTGSAPVIVTAHVLSSVGATGIVWGAARQAGQPTPLYACLAIVVVSSILLGFAVMFRDTTVIVLAQNGGSAMLFAIGAMVLWQARSEQLADRLLVWVMSLFAAHGFTRPLAAMLVEGKLDQLIGGLSIFRQINIAIVTLLAAVMAMLLLWNVLRDQIKTQRGASAVDVLSGLRLRTAYEAEAKALLTANRAKGQNCSLIVADIDHFKRVNDEHGHLAGDKVIAAFAGMIGQMTRPVDVTGRIGGEEFCILVSTCDLHYAANLAERIRIAFAASGGAGAGAGADRPACTASFGVAQSRPEDTLRSLFERADAALYEAKGTGRNRVIRQAREAGETPASSGNDKGNAQKLPGAAYASSKQRRSA